MQNLVNPYYEPLLWFMINLYFNDEITFKILRIGWDQSSKFVKIYISSVPGIDGLTEENVTATFDEK